MDFGELKNDRDLITKTTNLTTSIQNVRKYVEAAINYPNYDELPPEDKVKLDLFLAYATNSLFWVNCKLEDVDLMEHGIRNEMSRIRSAMLRERQLEERRTIRPVIDKGAAGRFIRFSLWTKMRSAKAAKKLDKKSKTIKK